MPRAEVHAAARAAIARAGWQIVGDDAEAGRLEAVATTRWFRFKDDIVVRLRDRAEGGTRIDMRSKSRIGRSDLGTNARRKPDFVTKSVHGKRDVFRPLGQPSRATPHRDS